MRPRIGVDMDGVLFNFQGRLIDFHNRKYGTDTKIENGMGYDLDVAWGISGEKFMERVMEFYHSPEFFKIEPVEGAVSGSGKLIKDFDVFVLTARPQEIRNKTLHSLGKHFPFKFKDVIMTGTFSLDRGKSKSDICLEKGIEVFVDDFYENVRECARRGVYSIIFNAPWNRAHEFLESRIARAANWDEVVQLAKAYDGLR